MGDDLTISGGGSTAVATDELFAAAQSLHRLALEAAALRTDLAEVDRRVSMGGLQAAHAPASAARAEGDIDQAQAVCVEIEAAANGVGWALSAAAEAYGFVERFIGSVGLQLAAGGAALAGTVVSAAAIAAPAAVAAGRVALREMVDAHMFAGDPAAASTGPHPNNGLVTNPLAAGLVRDATMGLDDGIMAAAGVPYPIALMLGDSELGVSGLDVAGATLLGAGATVGLLTETQVRQVAAQSHVVSAQPASFADRLDRVPDAENAGGPQVVIEKYEQHGKPDRFEVYVAGTVTFSPEATTEPWDMTSNIANSVGAGSGSFDSVVKAMHEAGIDESSQVQLTGYSQGGATAAWVASSGLFDVVGLTTFGAPTGQIPIPDDIPTVIVEHSDDIVPAFGGVQANQQALIVERDVFAGRDIPTDYAVPAHHIEYYEETARLMDDAASDQVRDAAARLDAFGAGATKITSTAYTFERVDPSAQLPAHAGGSGR